MVTDAIVLNLHLNIISKKQIKTLTLGEVATLVGVINNPTQFDPIRKPENARKKRDRVLFRMRDEGYITKEQYEAEIAKDIQVNPGKKRFR